MPAPYSHPTPAFPLASTARAAARGSATSVAPALNGATRAASRAESAAGRSHADHLAVSGIALSYADRRVLNDITFTARAGDRIGLIGENGTGKSTLLGVIAGTIEPSSGTVMHPGSVGLLAQELPYPDGTPMSEVLDDAQTAALQTLRALERLGAEFAERPDDPSVAEEYSAALEEAERSGAWSAEAHRGDVVSGLGLGGFSAAHPIGELSGGQRLRLALAAILLTAPHTLLLDEPSNHLDDASAAYLERVLRDWPGIVIVASHDRALLDSITTRILDLDPLPLPARELADAALLAPAQSEGNGAAAAPHTSTSARTDADTSTRAAATPATDDPGSGFGVRLWGVGYSAARSERRAELARWRSRYVAESTELAALVHEIEVGSREVNKKHESKSESRITKKFYADKDARVTSRRARNARMRLEALERDRVRRPPEPLRFTGFASAELDPSPVPPADVPQLSVDRVAQANRLAPTSFKLYSGDRLLLAGPNGSGKSTLLAILAGELTPDTGIVSRMTRVGYLPQEVAFARPDRSAADHYRSTVGAEIAEIAPLAATGLLATRDLGRRVGELSVGQRRRLALATLVADPPPVLLLDEPTNHLSLTLVEELEEALHDYRGALIIATHDRWFRARWTDPVLTLGGGSHVTPLRN
ncbi:macrolide transport system ATP-binding/permease protein [Leucobacter luti]|uniref:ABC-F family ATP-binding cassette domain-containing protein n=1 Tax=Leucobacter luti TaxID=340320 RepID=UPI00105313FC|nr:ABC-F family ATP-binding cassette domain-containing protein [Leucobacter luti]MCW2288708.1 macrolide transport system ATP-binding/permease protein [Leucobacter luti]TCK45137.1 macrolide transport system ATP-binding/permease protein [Leucobacter luti]